MVVHETKNVDFKAEAAKGVVEDAVETEAVLVVTEDIATVIASQDDMINGPGNVNAFPFLSRHADRIPRLIKLSRPGPIRPIRPFALSLIRKIHIIEV